MPEKALAVVVLACGRASTSGPGMSEINRRNTKPKQNRNRKAIHPFLSDNL
jgi:hypothetical protein